MEPHGHWQLFAVIEIPDPVMKLEVVSFVPVILVSSREFIFHEYIRSIPTILFLANCS